MTTNNVLMDQIEQLVRTHIEGIRSTAAAAVERAFAITPRQKQGAATKVPATAGGRKAQAPRRATEELAALGEQFYAALCRQPGETMTTLAPQVGASPRTLQVVVARLKRAGRVRAVGQRQHARYFPMTGTAATTMTATA
jgi:hypothetical protein